VPYNLVLQSNQFDTTWFNSSTTETGGQSGYDGSNNAWLLSLTGAAGRIIQTISQSGVQTFSVYAKAGTYNFLDMFVLGASIGRAAYFDLSNGTVGTTFDVLDANIQNVGNGWYRCSIRFNDTISNIRLYPAVADNNLTGASGNIYIQNAQLVKGDQPKDYLKTTDRLDIPRIDYTNGEPSILLEPSRTNSVNTSLDFTSPNWTLGATTVTSNNIASPESITNASKLQADGTNASHYILDTAGSCTSGSSYTYSIFVKKGTLNYVQLIFGSATFGTLHQNFDLDKGEIGSSSGTLTAFMNKFPNNWYRIGITATATANGNITPFVILANSSTMARIAGFDSSDYIYVYGAQVEAGSYATSLIHTSGSAVTRSQDAATNAGNSDLFNDSEGVLYIETQALVDEADARFISIDAGNGQNRVILGYPSSASSRITGYLQSSAGGGMTGNIDNIDTTEKHKIAFKYKSNDCSIFIDGVKRLQNNSVTMPVGLNTLNFTNGIANSGRYKGNLNSIIVFKEALTDLELEKLTGYNNHELYMNYYNRLSYLGLAEEYNVESDINNYIL
jgi:hypothetical protein